MRAAFHNQSPLLLTMSGWDHFAFFIKHKKHAFPKTDFRSDSYWPFYANFWIRYLPPPPGGHYLFLIWPIRGCAAGQGMVFYLSVLNRVYNFVRVCPNVRPMFSTERALLEATNEWLWNIENNLLIGVIFLDLKKALTPWIMLSYWEKLYGGQFSIS